MPKGHSSVYRGMSLCHCPLIFVPDKVFHIFLVMTPLFLKKKALWTRIMQTQILLGSFWGIFWPKGLGNSQEFRPLVVPNKLRILDI